MQCLLVQSPRHKLYSLADILAQIQTYLLECGKCHNSNFSGHQNIKTAYFE